MSEQAENRDVEEVLGLDRSSGRRRTIKRSLGALAIAVLAVAAAMAAWRVAQNNDGRQFITQTVERGDLDITVTATGTLEPTNEVDVSSELSGIIRRVLVDHNDPVRMGQALAELDTDKIEAEVAHARATLVAAEARLKEAEATREEAKRNFERYTELVERKVASEQKFDEAEARFARAEATVQSAKADIAVAEADLTLRETDLGKACICSPIDGVVLNRNVDPGQTVASTLQAPVLFTVAEDLTVMELQVDVDEADVSLVDEGQPARFTVDAYPDRTFPAAITKVRFAPATTEGVVTYKTHLSVDNSEGLLRPGMTATAEISVRTVKDALLVPNEALRFVPPKSETDDKGDGLLGSILPRPPGRNTSSDTNEADSGNQKRLWILEDGGPVAMLATVGLSDGQKTEILAGNLGPGRQVVIDVRDAGS